MKIRTGFVSNSSSASFICELCADGYEIECRGGTDEDWEAPTMGICENCQTTHFICHGEIIEQTESIKTETWNYSDREYINAMNQRACLTCFATDNQFAKDRADFAKLISDPNRELSEVEKKVVELWDLK